MATSQNPVLIDASLFDPAVIKPEVHAFNQKLMDIMKGAPKWYQVGAAKYREMRARGETPLPAATLLDSAEATTIPSRDSGREIPCRILKPTNGKPVTGVYMHIHGGGWVLQTEASQDIVLQDIANTNGVLMFSVGYRLAPEHPFPAGPNDCYDAAEWLIDNAESKLGATLKYVGGESAGGHLSMLVMLHLLQHAKSEYSSFEFKGLILHFGAYDMTWTPSTYIFNPPDVLVLDRDLMNHYAEAFLPGMSYEEKRHPGVSPLFADLNSLRGRLPPALFTCGTFDCLLDDTVFMSAKYQMAGAKTEVLIVPGGCHGYCMYPKDTNGAQADIAMERVAKFIGTHQ
ncbi:hypothetical protein H2198_009707 [Neophaeococcomyces mojaviensis]|uniref:Uncharacterized protein n=1 Tax=Neophaeococcomyces mojaviensis TaxID=3383035 RepID=A0ACC2ZTP0_9EURO|nr:hypothetical protein H2198_009707 [Knufia sp. JES_112]